MNNSILDQFKAERTKIFTEMFENKNELGIYETAKAYNKLDKAFEELCRKECIRFATHVMYKFQDYSMTKGYTADDVINYFDSEFSNNHVSNSPSEYEYEMLFKSEPYDFCKIDGWYPIKTTAIKNPENIEKYIKSGLIRKIVK